MGVHVISIIIYWGLHWGPPFGETTMFGIGRRLDLKWRTEGKPCILLLRAIMYKIPTVRASTLWSSSGFWEHTKVSCFDSSVNSVVDLHVGDLSYEIVQFRKTMKVGTYRIKKGMPQKRLTRTMAKAQT